MENFAFCKGDEFTPLAGEEKKKEMENSILFDVLQAKDYRFSAYLLIILVAGIPFINEYVKGPPDRKLGVITYSICFCFFLYAISIIIKANKVIKKNS